MGLDCMGGYDLQPPLIPVRTHLYASCNAACRRCCSNSGDGKGGQENRDSGAGRRRGSKKEGRGGSGAVSLIFVHISLKGEG
jgi:hypothetical protein